MVNIHIVYEINLWPFNVGKNFALGNSQFGAGKLTKMVILIYKYKYSDCGKGVDVHENFLLSDGSGFGKNVIIFGADMSS